jgi:hypothetical protein
MSNSSVSDVARPERAVIRNTAASTVVLGAAGTAEILNSGATQGALGIRPASTHVANYTAASGEYVVNNHARLFLDVELRAAKAEVAAVVTFRIVLGKAGDAAEVGTVVYTRTIPAAAGTAEYYFRSPDISFDVAPGQVLTAQIESDTIADEVTITDLSIVYDMIPLVLGASI